MSSIAKNENYTKSACDWRYMASCTADTDCFIDCNMPCPHDKVKSPCDMCSISDCVKDDCEALKVYKNKKQEEK